MTDQATALTVVESPKVTPLAKTPLTAGNAPRAIVPVDFEGAYRIANVVVTAGMAPKTLNSVEKAMVAILHGLEVGLTPMNALQSIAVINGRPTIWGDGAIGLIRASGLLEYMHERFEGEGNTLTAVCIVKRKGEPKEIRGEFSWSDVLCAHLNAKEGPWQTYPRRMMQMRARWPLRDVFADVLKGLALKEEVEDMDRQDIQAPQIPDNSEPPARRKVPSPPLAEVVEVQPKKEKVPELPTDGFPGDKPIAPTKDDGLDIPEKLRRAPPTVTDDERDWLESIDNAFAGCEGANDLIDQQEQYMTPRKDSVSGEAWRRATKLLASHTDRIAKDA